jgi:hypothetical protein
VAIRATSVPCILPSPMGGLLLKQSRPGDRTVVPGLVAGAAGAKHDKKETWWAPTWSGREAEIGGRAAG